MSRLSIAKFYLLALTISTANVRDAAAQQFPYTAYVTTKQAYVRSGPGQRYYPTGQIPQGFAVEVYRHDDDEWCAVRPPQGSFSWVLSHQVRKLSASIVEVIDDNVVARVGSTLSPARSAVQVLLPSGERLELISTAEEDPRWVRIAAPSGEFRWIAASELSRQPPIEEQPSQPDSGSNWVRQLEHNQTDQLSETPDGFDHLVQNNQAPVLQEQGDPNALEIVAGSPAALQLTQFQAQTTTGAQPELLSEQSIPAVLTAPQPRVRFEGLARPTVAKVGSIEELELRLSLAVVQPPQQWQLTPLEAAASAMLDVTKAPPERAQLREVLDRITRFQEVQQRYSVTSLPPLQQDPFAASDQITDRTTTDDTLTSLSTSIRDRARRDLASESNSRERVQSTLTETPRFDAAGVLKPVVSKREQAPQYALIDEQGKVVSFVTPTPDLNLKPYVGRRIGVHGTRGFMPEFRRAHVTAARVSPIEGPVQR